MPPLRAPHGHPSKDPTQKDQSSMGIIDLSYALGATRVRPCRAGSPQRGRATCSRSHSRLNRGVQGREAGSGVSNLRGLWASVRGAEEDQVGAGRCLEWTPDLRWPTLVLQSLSYEASLKNQSVLDVPAPPQRLLHSGPSLVTCLCIICLGHQGSFLWPQVKAFRLCSLPIDGHIPSSGIFSHHGGQRV